VLALTNRRSRNRCLAIMALFASAQIVSGCDLPNDLWDSGQHPPVHVEWLVDRTPSWPRSALAAALSEARRLCESLQPGDRLTIRYIADRSYSAQEVVTQVHLNPPVVLGGLPSPAAIRQRRADSAATSEVIRQGCSRIPAAHEVPMAPRTDITSALAAASGSLRTPGGYRRILILSSDLEETESPGSVKLNLGSVIVRLFAVETKRGRLADLERSIASWRERLMGWGAADVQLIPPGGTLAADLDRGATQPINNESGNTVGGRKAP